MPLVRIDVVEGRRTPDQLTTLADVVQQTMIDVFAAPERDRYQVITEHRPGLMIIQDTGLGFERTDDVCVIQVFQQGRNAEQKKQLYATLAERLESQAGLAPTDLVVTIAANTADDWSFGQGEAQFLTGAL